MPTSTVEQITNSIDTLRRNAAARPHWTDELDLWERIIDPLLDLAVAHERVAGNRQAVATAQADAASVIADADATVAAWQLVDNVLDAKMTESKLAGLEEHRDAAEKETEQLRRDERRHRHALARLLTHRRDAAADELKAANEQLAATTTALETADEDLQSCLSRHATASEQVRELQSKITESAQALADAVTAGLCTEGADPAKVDASLVEQIAAARTRRDGADKALKDIESQVSAAQNALSVAWVQGRNTAPLESLADLPFLVTRLDYLGDSMRLGWRSPPLPARPRKRRAYRRVRRRGCGSCLWNDRRDKAAR